LLYKYFRLMATIWIFRTYFRQQFSPLSVATLQSWKLYKIDHYSIAGYLHSLVMPFSFIKWYNTGICSRFHHRVTAGNFCWVNHQSVWIECPYKYVEVHLEIPMVTRVICKKKRVRGVVITCLGGLLGNKFILTTKNKPH